MLKDALKFYHDSYLVAYCLEIVTPFAHIHGMCVFTWSWTLSLKLWVTLGNWMPPPWDCTWAWNVLVSAHLLLSHDSHITYVASPASPREMIGMWSKACLFWTSPTQILWLPTATDFQFRKKLTIARCWDFVAFLLHCMLLSSLIDTTSFFYMEISDL